MWRLKGLSRPTDTVFLKTAATRQVTAGAAEFGSAEIRCSSFDGIVIETKSTDQRNTEAETSRASSIYISTARGTQCDRHCPFCAGGFRAVGS